jgi:chemotaxis protein CheD
MVIKVGMADLQITSSPNRLKTMGLGSCVGVTLHDSITKLAGMAHIMLPSSELARDGGKNVAKYANTAIPEMIKLLTQMGAKKANLVAKMAGGAQMFAFSSAQDHLRIGPRNVEACKEALSKWNIPIESEETGGSNGRTIELDSSTGLLYIWTVNREAKAI